MAADGPEPGAVIGTDRGKPESVPDERQLPSTQQVAHPQSSPPAAMQQAPERPPSTRETPVSFPEPSSSQNLPARSPEPTQRIKQADEIFCSSCGRAIKKQAVICVHCGVPVQGGSLGGAQPKSKTTAVLLAVFLAFWTWCYTYKRDAWKFWLNLVLSVVTVGIWAITVGWVWAVIDAAVKPTEYYQQFPNYR